MRPCIAERRGEKLQRLGPVVENVERELADDIRRVIEIMARRRLLLPKPPSLIGTPLEIEFDSMIRVAQRAAETAVLEKSLAVVTQVKTAYPEAHVEDNLDMDKTMRKYLDLSNFPKDCLRDDKEVMQLRMGRQRAQQQAMKDQQAMQLATHAAPGAAKAALDASQIDPGGMQNAINLMSGLGGQAPGQTGLPQ